MTTLPIIKVPAAAGPVDVRLSLIRLASIEQACGLSYHELMQQLFEAVVGVDWNDENEVPSAEQLRQMLRVMRIDLMLGVVGGALDVARDQVEAVVGVENLKPAFMEIARGLIVSFAAMQPRKEATASESHPTGASSASSPSPGSSGDSIGGKASASELPKAF